MYYNGRTVSNTVIMLLLYVFTSSLLFDSLLVENEPGQGFALFGILGSLAGLIGHLFLTIGFLRCIYKLSIDSFHPSINAWFF